MSQNSKPQKTKAQWYHIKRTYGLTPEQYYELDEGRCPICLRDWSIDVRPCVDHDHSTGEIRGLVCLYCNHRVLGRHRDGELISRVASYLKADRKGWIVPKKKKKRKKNGRKRPTKKS